MKINLVTLTHYFRILCFLLHSRGLKLFDACFLEALILYCMARKDELIIFRTNSVISQHDLQKIRIFQDSKNSFRAKVVCLRLAVKYNMLIIR